MICKKIEIPIYNYTLNVYVVKKYKDNIEPILKELKKQDFSKEVKDEIIDGCKNCFNGGITVYNSVERKLIIVVYTCKTKEKYLEILMHEKRHCEDEIINHLEIEGGEACAYLAGYLAENLFTVIKKIFEW